MPAWYGEWLDGVETFFSGYEPASRSGSCATPAWRSCRDELETIREPEGDATFLWVLARKPG